MAKDPQQLSARFVQVNFEKDFRSVKHLTHPWRLDAVQSSRREAIPFALSADDVEEMMYQSVSVARKSSGDFTIVMTFALLGLALSLLLIGKASLIDPEYMATLLLSF